jgi:predicted regulator of Ras-like GTPase activity (Roadblock/LC7/MglB family)
MEPTKTPTAQEILEPRDSEFFVERLAQILLMQIEQESLVNIGLNENETLGMRQFQSHEKVSHVSHF